MRYEVQEQIKEIDTALFIIRMSEIPEMKVSDEELEASLKKAESCMCLMMRVLAQKDITMKELNNSLRND